jgi:predicted amidohydrolase
MRRLRAAQVWLFFLNWRLRPSSRGGSSRARRSIITTSEVCRIRPCSACSIARALRIGFYVGYAELTSDRRRFNCSILVDGDGEILGRYRKVHLPGSVEPRAGARYQQLEKRYFEYGNLGFPAFRAGPDWRHAIMGMMICNDRRWPESWRVLGLQGVELVCIGYNSAAYDPNGGVTEDAALRTFHSKLVTQANAYMNATWAIAVAKAGNEDGSGLIGGSCIVDPNGRIVAETQTLADEVVVADLDLDLCRQGKDKMFNFAAHRRPEQYTVITERAGVIEPTALDAIQYYAGTRSAGRRS